MSKQIFFLYEESENQKARGRSPGPRWSFAREKVSEEAELSDGSGSAGYPGRGSGSARSACGLASTGREAGVSVCGGVRGTGFLCACQPGPDPRDASWGAVFRSDCQPPGRVHHARGRGGGAGEAARAAGGPDGAVGRSRGASSAGAGAVRGVADRRGLSAGGTGARISGSLPGRANGQGVDPGAVG